MSSDLLRTTVTVYNSYTTGLPPFSMVTQWDKVIIRGVHWEEDIERNADSTGRSHISQSVLILIPKGVDQGGKTYIPQAGYEALTNDNDQYWTLAISETNPTFIMLGEGRDLNDLYTIRDLTRDHKVIQVHGVSDMLDSPVQPHLEVRGV